jgi:hypothetical protein
MMTKQTPALALLTLALAGATVGCGDPQADDGYVGEPLLSIKGSIVAASEATLAGDIVPAIGWTVAVERGDFEHIRVQETEVRGEFPSGFTMNIVSPPPGDNPRAQPVKGHESEPVVQMGYIIALPEEHPDEIVVGYERGAIEEECTEDESGTTCVSQHCDYYGECFTQRCHWETEECTLVEGDLAVAAGLGLAKGIVDNYGVIYLDRPAQRGSVWAYTFGAEELAAGYHLVEFIEDDGDDSEYTQADFDCRNEATDQAAKEFEELYGVSLDSDEINDDDPRIEALFFLENAAMQAAGCKPDLWGRIADGDEKLVMKLGDFELQ